MVGRSRKQPTQMHGRANLMMVHDAIDIRRCFPPTFQLLARSHDTQSDDDDDNDDRRLSDNITTSRLTTAFTISLTLADPPS